jgi:hypothetical protein
MSILGHLFCVEFTFTLCSGDGVLLRQGSSVKLFIRFRLDFDVFQ